MAVTVAGDWLLPIAVMNRCFFLKSGTLAVAAAAAPRAAQAKPKGKTLDPADPANMVVPSAKLDIERPPPKSVTLHFSNVARAPWVMFHTKIERRKNATAGPAKKGPAVKKVPAEVGPPRVH